MQSKPQTPIRKPTGLAGAAAEVPKPVWPSGKKGGAR